MRGHFALPGAPEPSPPRRSVAAQSRSVDELADDIRDRDRHNLREPYSSRAHDADDDPYEIRGNPSSPYF